MAGESKVNPKSPQDGNGGACAEDFSLKREYMLNRFSSSSSSFTIGRLWLYQFEAYRRIAANSLMGTSHVSKSS